jgi:hypothetical protein
MLALDDPRWSDLFDAYGAATEIPDLLRKLASSPGPKSDYQAEPWFTLWSSLCHQGDVYSASYAALPHIVRIAIDARGPIAFDFFHLPTAIEIARFNGRGPEIPEFLADAYQFGIAMLMDCASAHRAEKWDEPMVLSVAAAQAVAKGQHRTAEALMNLDHDWISKIIDPNKRD